MAPEVTVHQDTLFDREDLLEWVVEVNEIFLNSTGAQDREVMDWWLLHGGRPGIAARTIHLAIFPPGALLYIRCDDEEEARWLRSFLVEKGLHNKGVAVRRLGQIIRCAGCDERRPYWARTRLLGQRCRSCWNESMWPGRSGGGRCA